MDTRPVATKPATYWVVTVTEAPDAERGLPGFKRRLHFEDTGDAMRAWEQAKAAGFDADAEYVQS